MTNEPAGYQGFPDRQPYAVVIRLTREENNGVAGGSGNYFDAKPWSLLQVIENTGSID
jgi:hypothetical protein